jgi:hypothetical protein
MKQLNQVGCTEVTRSEALVDQAPEINRKSGQGVSSLVIQAAVQLAESRILAVKVSGVAPLRSQRHPAHQLRVKPFDRVSRMGAKRQRSSAKGLNQLRRTQACAF